MKNSCQNIDHLKKLPKDISKLQANIDGILNSNKQTFGYFNSKIGDIIIA